MLADYHMHTKFSDDSTCPMEKAIQTAIAKNLDEICFTEHIDFGHLDMINRYDQKGIYPFNKVFDLVNEILKQVINDHKGIEINTSCYRYGLKDLTPSVEILKLYKKLGGDIITIGSDGHDVDQYGFNIQETKQILKDLGFKYIYTFDKMKSIAHLI